MKESDDPSEPEGTDDPPEDESKFPPDLVDSVWSHVTRDEIERPVASSIEQLRSLIYPAFQASLQTEEGRPVRFRLLFDLSPHEDTVRFEQFLHYEAGNLVKLAPTIGLDFRYLVVAPKTSDDGSPLQIWGILDPVLLTKRRFPVSYTLWVPDEPLQGFRISVLEPGCVRVETEGGAAIELRSCSIRYPFPVSQVRLVGDWYVDAARRLGLHPPGEENRDEEQLVPACALVRRTWESVLSQVAANRHGGTFLVVPEVAECEALLKIKYRLESDALCNVIRQRLAVEPAVSFHALGKSDIDIAVIDKLHLLERNMAHLTNLVVSLAAVDGAVVLGRNLTIHGFGAEIQLNKDGSEGKDGDEEKIEFVRLPHGQPPPRRLSSFGMRHRSAYRFCKRVPGSLAFVISQDGNLLLFQNEAEKVTAVDGIAHNVWGCVFRIQANEHADAPESAP